MSIRSLYVGITTTVMLATSIAFAVEKKIQRSALPPAVEKTVQAQLQGATIKGFSKDMEKGKVRQSKGIDRTIYCGILQKSSIQQKQGSHVAA